MTRATGARFLAELSLLAAAGAALVPGAVRADLQPFRYPSLLTPLPAAGPKDSLSDHGTDEVWTNAIDLGFDLVWQGTTYRSVTVSSHGAVSFVKDCGRAAPAASCMGTPPLDLAASPADDPGVYLAPWWGDLDVIRGVTRVRHQTTGTKPDRVFTVEWEQVLEGGPGDGTSVPYTFQLLLHETANVATLQYGRAGAGSHAEGVRFASAAEAPPGALGDVEVAALLGCGASCGPADFPAVQAVLVPRPPGAELVPWVEAKAVSADARSLSLTVRTELRDAGRADASGASARVYLSTDRAITAADIHLADADRDGVAIPAGGAAEQETSISLPRPKDGLYYLGIVGSLPGEAIPGNDVQSAPEPIVLGKDLLGAVASDVGRTGPGEIVPVAITLVNRGTDDTGNFTYRLYLAKGSKPAAADPVLITGVTRLDALTTSRIDVDANIPGNVEGAFRFVLEIDTPGAGAVAEVVEDNNVAVGPSITVDPSDLAILGVELVGDPAEVYYGLPVEAEITVMNVGRWPARGFFVDLKASGRDGFVSPRDATVWQAPEDCLALPCAGAYAGACDAVTSACEPSCRTDDACPDRLTCESGACTPLLLPGEIRTYHVTGVVPDRDGIGGGRLDPGACSFGALVDPLDLLFEGSSGNGNNQEDVPARRCRYPAVNGVVPELLAPSQADAGESIPVFRTVRNAGNAAGTVRYAYVLSQNEILSRNDLVLPIAGLGSRGALELAPGEEDQRVERLQLPPNLAPVEGGYVLGVIVDPDHEVDELREDDDVTIAARRLEVGAAAFRIVSEVPPTGVVGAAYAYQLRAIGGDGRTSWALHPASRPLPAGLGLGGDGRVVGALTEAALAEAGVEVPGHVVFTVEASSGSARAQQAFAIPVVHASGPLTIETGSCLHDGDADCTRRLPLARAGVPYRAGLAASGGQPPYRWSVIAPATFQVEGALLSGTPPPQPDVVVRVRVEDRLGGSVTSDLRVEIAGEAASLRILTQPLLPDADLGVAYSATIDAQGGDESTRTWTIPAGALPPGLSDESGVRCRIFGTPTAPGTFVFRVMAADGEGSFAQSQFTILVRDSAQVFTVATTSGDLPRARSGAPYDAQLHASDPVTWRIFSGALPPGLSLSPEGRISGTVATDARIGPFAFAVEARNVEGARATRTLAIGVEARPIAPRWRTVDAPGGGCGGCSTGGLPDPALLLVLAALLARGATPPAWGRRRSARRSSPPTAPTTPPGRGA